MRRALSVLLAFALVGVALADSYSELNSQIKGLDDASASRLLKEKLGEDSDLYTDVRRLPLTIKQLRAILANRAAAESASQLDSKWKTRARENKAANPLYRDNDKDKQGSNWLAKAYEKLFEAIRKLFKGREPTMPNMGPPPSLIGPWAVYLVWGILGVVLVVCVFLAVRHFSWKAKLKKKAALMDEDEPERTLDEWLGLADDHERNGRFREAVRCLYLACLLKFDEYNVARFDRGQTNWEHLARIRKSPNAPSGFDFLPPTQAFDLVWYGHRVEGKADVDRFRAWYRQTLESLGRAK